MQTLSKEDKGGIDGGGCVRLAVEALYEPNERDCQSLGSNTCIIKL